MLLTKQQINSIWHDNKRLLLFIFLMVLFRSSLADWNVVPTGSMKPTIVEGDRILVNKVAYDVRIPFTQISLYRHSNPLRGDIIVFNSAVSKKRLVKRVIGMPGDRVSMHNNVVSISGQPLLYSVAKGSGVNGFVDKTESLPGLSHTVRQRIWGSRLSNFAEVTIPENYYLVLGDNRDNSADSRVIGLVPRNEIVGRTQRVVMSLNKQHYYLPRAERFLKIL